MRGTRTTTGPVTRIASEQAKNERDGGTEDDAGARRRAHAQRAPVRTDSIIATNPSRSRAHGRLGAGELEEPRRVGPLGDTAEQHRAGLLFRGRVGHGHPAVVGAGDLDQLRPAAACPRARSPASRRPRRRPSGCSNCLAQRAAFEAGSPPCPARSSRRRTRRRRSAPGHAVLRAAHRRGRRASAICQAAGTSARRRRWAACSSAAGMAASGHGAARRGSPGGPIPLPAGRRPRAAARRGEPSTQATQGESTSNVIRAASARTARGAPGSAAAAAARRCRRRRASRRAPRPRRDRRGTASSRARRRVGAPVARIVRVDGRRRARAAPIAAEEILVEAEEAARARAARARRRRSARGTARRSGARRRAAPRVSSSRSRRSANSRKIHGFASAQRPTITAAQPVSSQPRSRVAPGQDVAVADHRDRARARRARRRAPSPRAGGSAARGCARGA